ncbi:cytochrome P450 [Lizonia empirigonia]|nr:cytochrome P450 [Lizonia empirigonia]
MSVPFYTVVFAILALVLHKLSKIGRRPADYPPGPPTLPLIGNLHLMPKEKGHLQFQKWAEEYGPVYSLILGTKVMIVLSSDQAIKDLLDKRSNIYSSRPDMYMGQIISGSLRMLLMEYGETWRMVRKIVHNNLNIKASRTYVPYQDLENKAMLMGLLEKPELFVDHIRRYTNSLTTQMVFGFRTTSINDPKLKQLFHGFERFCEVTGSQTAALLDVFPILRNLPDWAVPVRRYAKQLHEKESELYIGHWINVKKAIKNGTAKPCFCVDLVRAQDEEHFSDALAGYTSGSLLEAGSDTTAAILVGFIQAMVLFPDVVKAAQEELDRVCGEQFPTLDDEKNLPYIRGCVKESMRWMPTDILGVPHAVIQDDEYMGYKIPKGAGVMWNVWAVHMDAKRHPDPRRFDPARYLDDHQTAAEAANNPDASKRDHFVFGAGRRLCQGMHIGERSLFLAMSRLLWAFEFHKARDTNGNEIVPDADDLTEGLFVLPKAFPARITPRDAGRVKQIKLEWEKMEGLLDGDLQWKALPEGMIWRKYEQSGSL